MIIKFPKPKNLTYTQYLMLGRINELTLNTKSKFIIYEEDGKVRKKSDVITEIEKTYLNR